eukprot:COSAG01_NODE_1902_length_8963_cov_29.997405_7_plen_434_part_00
MLLMVALSLATDVGAMLQPGGNHSGHEGTRGSAANQQRDTMMHVAAAAQWFVSEHDGDDSNDGLDPSQPFRTLDRARAAVADWRSTAVKRRRRRRQQQGRQQPTAAAATAAAGELRVVIRGGEYSPLHLGPSDGGASAENVVVYAAWPGERVIISGGFHVPPSALHVIPHPKRSGQNASAVLHVALPSLGFTAAEFGALAGDTDSGPNTNPATPGEFGCANHKMEAHLGRRGKAMSSKALPLARYPNPWKNGTYRWMYLSRPIGWSPNCSHPSRHAPSCQAGGCCASHQDFIPSTDDAARVASWKGETDPWLHGYFQQDWADTIAQVADITNTGTVHISNSTPTCACTYLQTIVLLILADFEFTLLSCLLSDGTKPIQSGARWLGLNLLAELDDAVSGEYYLDRHSGDLCVLDLRTRSVLNVRIPNCVRTYGR